MTFYSQFLYHLGKITECQLRYLYVIDFLVQTFFMSLGILYKNLSQFYPILLLLIYQPETKAGLGLVCWIFYRAYYAPY